MPASTVGGVIGGTLLGCVAVWSTVRHWSGQRREEVVDADASLSGDLAQKERGKIAGSVNGHGGGCSVGVAKAFVGAVLAYFLEAELGEDRDDFVRLERGDARHDG